MNKEELNIPSDERQYSLNFIRKNNAFFISEDSEKVTAGYTEKTPESALESIRTYHGKKIEFIKVEQSKLAYWIGKKDGLNDDEKIIPEENENKIDDFSNDAPAVNLVNSICIEGIKKGASDIHVESFENSASVRYRMNGLLEKSFDIKKEIFAKISSRIKLMSGMNILEHRLPQDGRMSVNVDSRTTDIRVSSIPSSDGESIVMRILSRNSTLNNIEELGFLNTQINDIKNMLKIPHGLILVTGPTGSGKTTTLHSMLKEITDEKIKIISIEDPVEYKIKGVNQIQVNEEIGLTFSSILRRVLRQDPDVIMVGEIRDSETASLAVRAALTGHLVLSTIHTNDAVSAIDRLKNMGIPPYMIASVLKGAISQRLVTTIKNTRTIIAEEFLVDEAMSDLIMKDPPKTELKNFLKNRNTKFLRDIALFKIKNRIVKKEAAEHEIQLIP
ncbi:MAG: type II/IV secretion system protein [Treponema sp.]|uniref:Type II secretory ATPase GspE/PulE/Tfp pilus assembly ATPase PilB-like protein n=1 Tax=Treponema rectale TaxID=744512 RepID=A0A840SBT9_9SPIR|nr:GspE/PulE family protein [Treponema rectale]MBB5218180.1 type II secretory ATPase GspE/PulE/Tfp pilus assembly ATPase PilB-like protein [Treponema rectale]MBO6177428.1 type II/IV secretion system protein [Treponema sp.]QOS40115.1 type II/IV secretion system protein [Treponema rectale]